MAYVVYSPNFNSIVLGIGTTKDAALKDAIRTIDEAGVKDEMTEDDLELLPCTQRFYKEVKKYGADDKLRWTSEGGVADLDPL